MGVGKSQQKEQVNAQARQRPSAAGETAHATPKRLYRHTDTARQQIEDTLWGCKSIIYQA